jgi:serine/threonine-protein kinase
MGRGDQCTSADAGGFPISALLFSADEVAAGHIDHAIRFILPNADIEKKTYVRPATHATNSSGGANAVPYGARLRIRDDRIAAVLAGLPNVYARTVAQALHDYGMFLSDGGTIALTAEDDGDTVAKWDNTTSNRWMGTGLGVLDLASMLVTDFEMVDGGTRVPWNGNCTRTPITM